MNTYTQKFDSNPLLGSSVVQLDNRSILMPKHCKFSQVLPTADTVLSYLLILHQTWIQGCTCIWRFPCYNLKQSRHLYYRICILSKINNYMYHSFLFQRKMKVNVGDQYFFGTKNSKVGNVVKLLRILRLSVFKKQTRLLMTLCVAFMQASTLE